MKQATPSVSNLKFVKHLTVNMMALNPRVRLRLLALCFTLLFGLWGNRATQAQFTSITFGVGRGIHLVDPHGRNQIPILVDHDTTVTATLYALNPADFVRRYTNYDPYWAQPIDVSGLPVAFTWSAPVTTTAPYQMNALQFPPTATNSSAVASGLYVLHATDEQGNAADTYVVVSRHALVVKRGAGGQIVVWASRLQEQTPVADVAVAIYDETGALLTTGTTDAAGLARLNIGTASPRMVVGTTADDTTVAGLDWQWRLQDGTWYWSDPTQDRYRIFLYTDRPLYRPGQAIHYQAIVRNDLIDGYTPLAPTEMVTVTLRDSRNNLLSTTTAQADEFGTFDGTVTLSDEPPLGTYHLAVTINGQTQTQPLQVEEYRKPEYAVEVKTPAPFALSGEAIPVTVTANYFFGQPVTDAPIAVTIYQQQLYRYYAWWDEQFYEYYGGREVVRTFTGQTDNAGQWQQSLPTADWANGEEDLHYTIEATVTDARDLPVSGSGGVNVYWHSFALTINTEKYGYHEQEAVVVTVAAADHAGVARPQQPVTVRVVKPGYGETPDVDMLPPQQVTTDNNGRATVTYPAIPQGWYQLLATSTDARGRQISATRYLWIYGEGAYTWWDPNNQGLTIMADRDSYAPGDTAQLLIQANSTGVALLTLERAGVHTEQLVTISGPLTTVDVPITADFAPNIFAHLHLFDTTPSSESEGQYHEGRLLSAEVELQVPAPEQQLTITVNKFADAYAPGTTIPVNIAVTDHAGAPVHVRVAVALVDEALFALQEDRTADLFATFYGARPNGVATFGSLVHDPIWALWDRGAPIELDGEETIAEDDTAQGETRRNFLDTAYWNPTLVTDGNGQVTVNVPLPDNLTTWRVIVRAVTVATAVGETREQLLVTKELIARPALPRFAVVGDHFLTEVIAQNFTGGATAATGNLRADALTLLNGATHSLDLPQQGTAVAQWTAVASTAGTNLVTATVDSPVGRDQVELSFPIKPFAVPDRWVAAGLAAPTATEIFTMPLNAIHDVSNLTIRVAPSLALGVMEGLDELIDYPYGCVEQTMSRILPTAVAARAFADLALTNPRADELPAIMSQGLQKLYGFQHEDGGWGWFYDDDGGVYLTAYVLYGLNAVQQAGFAVEERVIEDGFAYLDGHLAQVEDAGTKAYALYVKAEAGRGDLAQTRALLPQLSKMDTAMQAALALALQTGGDHTGAQQVAQYLLATVTESPTTAYWALPTVEWNWQQWRTMSSTEKNSALALRALVAIAPDAPVLPKVVRWLMQQRQGAGWRDTQATTFAVLGLVDYARQRNELQTAYTYQISLNDLILASGEVVAGQMAPLAPLIVPGSALHSGENRLVITHSGANAPFYYTALLDRQLYYDGFAATGSVDQGLALRRAYRLIEGTPRNDGAYNVGDLVEVTLNVTAQTRMAYLLVEDPLPGGFEAVNARLNPVSYGGDRLFFWEDWGYNRKNIRDDRVDFFVTTLLPGQQTFTYQMRATTPGEFSVLPGQASPMYNDEIWGRSAAAVMKVAPELLTQSPTLTGDFDHNCQITDFDLQLAAVAWGARVAQRNLVDDDLITLQDLAAIGARRGATCLADRALPTSGTTAVHLESVAPAQTTWIGEPIAVTIRAADLAGIAPAVGGYGVTLKFDPTQLVVADVQWHQQSARMLPLGPTVDSAAGVVRIGAYELAPDTGPTSGLTSGGATLNQAAEPLVTIHFTGRSVGATNITLVAAEAVDAAGRLLPTTVENHTGPITVDGERVFLPVVGR